MKMSKLIFLIMVTKNIKLVERYLKKNLEKNYLMIKKI